MRIPSHVEPRTESQIAGAGELVAVVARAEVVVAPRRSRRRRAQPSSHRPPAVVAPPAMPLDISILRAYRGGDPEKVRESQRRRFADVGLVDKVIAEDEAWRKLTQDVDDIKAEKNKKQKEITSLKLSKDSLRPRVCCLEQSTSARKILPDHTHVCTSSKDHQADLLSLGMRSWRSSQGLLLGGLPGCSSGNCRNAEGPIAKHSEEAGSSGG